MNIVIIQKLDYLIIQPDKQAKNRRQGDVALCPGVNEVKSNALPRWPQMD